MSVVARLAVCVVLMVMLVGGGFAAVADVRFTARLVMSDIPGVSGVLNGTINYYYNQTTGATNHWKRLDWGSPINTIELIDYGKTIRYKKCPSLCSAETYMNTVETLFITETDAAVVPASSLAGSPNCQKYVRDDGNINYLWYDATANALCRVEKTDGTVMQFSSVVSSGSSAAPQSKLTEASSWGCPTPTCSRIMDIVLVLDSSGSIEKEGEWVCPNNARWCWWWDEIQLPAEWSQVIEFSKKISMLYEISTYKSTIGAVFFSDYAKTVSDLTDSQSDFVARLTAKPMNSGTCLGCGMQQAISVFDKPVTGREELHPSRLVIVLTDGDPTIFKPDFVEQANILKGPEYNAVIIGIAVGDGIKMDNIKKFVSVIPGVETALYAESFDTLSTVIDTVIQRTCDPLPAQDCTGCSGYCSCSSTCTCPQCPASNACFNSWCDAATKGCKSTNTSCEDNNKCTIKLGCDPKKGCLREDKVCDDKDPCTVDSCSPSTGCITTAVKCPSDKCHTGECSSVVTASNPGGCWLKPIACTSTDPCMVASCDMKNGCTSSPMNCSLPVYDACMVSSCVAGKCVNTAVSCDDNNTCTDDVCDHKLGCQHKEITCDDGDVCTTNICLPTTPKHTCQIDTIPYCKDYCTGILNCSDAAHTKPCMVGKCVIAPGGESGMCEYTNRTLTVECNSGSKCIIDGCDSTTDKCFSFPKVCTPEPCKDVACNSATGACVYTDRVCTTNPDPCHPVTCNKATDKCERSDACPHQSCFDESCLVDGNNKAVCNYIDRNCTQVASECLINVCNNATDSCEHWERSCDDYLLCTTDRCDSATGCVYTPISCDDGFLCTNDTCNAETGKCEHVQKCADKKWCTNDNCNPLTGVCSFPAKDCSADLDGSACLEGYCNEKNHSCGKKYTANAEFDVCGGCIDLTNPNSSYYQNNSLASTSCLSAWSTTKLAVALTGAAIAGIIIAAIIAAVIVLAASSFGGYELIKRASQARPTSTVSNPLYESSEREMVNALYAGN